jgi:20S proteasome alpha/beta subunit
MLSAGRWQPFLLVVILIGLCDQSASSSTNGSSRSEFRLSPISNWQASWTASQAQGTVMAMIAQDCIVIVLRSPATNVHKPTWSIEENQQGVLLDGILVRRIAVEQARFSNVSPMVCYAPSLITVGPQSLCAMSGLALDVEHLCRRLQQYADDHYNVFQTSLTSYALTEKLAKTFQNVCMYHDSRPYGVQALIVGCDDIDHEKGWCLYSVDPSGSWQSWGKATAIGKYGRDIRTLLGKKLKSMSHMALSSIGIRQVVTQLMECWKETCKQENINTKIREDWEVLILRKDPENSSKSCLFCVPTEEIGQILDEVNSANAPQ